MRIIKIIFYIVLILLAVSFTTLNAGRVPVNLYLASFNPPLSLLMVITLAIGLFMGYLLCLPKYWKCKIGALKIKTQLKNRE